MGMEKLKTYRLTCDGTRIYPDGHNEKCLRSETLWAPNRIDAEILAEKGGWTAVSGYWFCGMEHVETRPEPTPVPENPFAAPSGALGRARNPGGLAE